MEKEDGLKGAVCRWLDARTEERRTALMMRGYVEGYGLWGAQIFEAMQGLSDTLILKPVSLSQVITDDVYKVSVPGLFVYHVDVIGSPKEVQLRIRRNLAQIRNVTIEVLVSQVDVKVVGNNVLICRKV